MPLQILLLDTSIHDRSNFKCEDESLIRYLHHHANQDMKKNLTACFVLVDEDSGDNSVKGYYTLANESISKDKVPGKYKKKIPYKYNVPVTLLGRLARDISMKGKGIGEYLLMDALNRSYRISQSEIGSMAVVVDPINDKAIEFYSKYGFWSLPDSYRMFLPMNAISKLFDN
ncbi:MAG: GNAT family N-acetyltransferase [Bacteroidales bacterium]|nr:GNAT family N-acetyltransferase [Bacteroidales bacterium]